MSPINVNLDDAVIEDGDYVVSVYSAEQKVSKTGNDMIELTFTITEGKHIGKALPGWEYLVFSPKAMARVAHALTALGVAQTGTFSLDAQTLVGKKALVTLSTVHQRATADYPAKDEQKVTNYQPAPVSAADKAVDAAIPQATIADDDIPF